MSIAVGIKCQDGCVLCADREMTNDDYKYYEGKISGFSLATGSFLLAQCAADVDDMPRFFEGLAARLKDSNKTPDEMKQEIGNVLADLREWTPERTDHQALIMLCNAPSELILLKTANGKVIPVYQSWAMIGAGESSLTHYLMKVLFKSGMALTMAQAVIYGIYVINQAKQHIAGCGSRGPTDIAYLKPSGEASVVPTIYIEAIERHWDLVEFQSSIALAKITDRRLQPAYIKKSLEELAEFLGDIHAKFKVLEL